MGLFCDLYVFAYSYCRTQQHTGVFVYTFKHCCCFPKTWTRPQIDWKYHMIKLTIPSTHLHLLPVFTLLHLEPHPLVPPRGVWKMYFSFFLSFFLPTIPFGLLDERSKSTSGFLQSCTAAELNGIEIDSVAEAVVLILGAVKAPARRPGKRFQCCRTVKQQTCTLLRPLCHV